MSWIDKELAGCELHDERLNKRLRAILGQLADGIGESIPLACQDWANTKAAYRFFSNDRVDEADIFSGHFQATRSRAEAADAIKLILHDTTEFSYQRADPDEVGFTRKLNTGKKSRAGLPQYRTKCGILMHSSLVLTEQGLPLGLSAVKFWTRKKFKGSQQLRKRICFTRIPIEQKESIRWLENLQQTHEVLGSAERCVHVADREGDIYELFSLAHEIRTHFLIRVCTNRLSSNGNVFKEIGETPVKGQHRLTVRDKEGKEFEAVLEIRYGRIRILPSYAKRKWYSPLTLTVISAREIGDPRGREKIEWKLYTNLPVRTRAEAIKKLKWYAMRWKIETFHKILKSGCRAEESKLRTADRITKLIAVFCILSWRIFWMTMINRSDPKSPQEIAFTDTEIELLDQLVKDKPTRQKKREKTIADYIHKLARLGGYLARASDPPPGIKIIWRGLSRLTDIQLGFEAGGKLVGN